MSYEKNTPTILIVDTYQVMRNYQKQEKENENSGRSIEIDSSYVSVITQNDIIVDDRNIILNNKKVSSISFIAYSESNNYVNSVIIYDILKISGDDIFSSFFSTKFLGRIPIFNGDEEILPAKFIDVELSCFTGELLATGTCDIYIKFALYDIANEFYGCFHFLKTVITSNIE